MLCLGVVVAGGVAGGGRRVGVGFESGLFDLSGGGNKVVGVLLGRV